LKPGGLLIGFDRVQPDTLTDEQVNKMLDTYYDKAFLIRNGYPEDFSFTRRNNGEHEYRKREWLDAFEYGGFKNIVLKKLFRSPEPLMQSVMRLAGLSKKKNKRYGKPVEEIKKFIKSLLKGEYKYYSPKDLTCFVLKK
jgi:hypothetical protein